MKISFLFVVGIIQQQIPNFFIYALILLLPNISRFLLNIYDFYTFKIRTLDSRVFSETFFDYDKYAKHYLGKTLSANRNGEKNSTYKKYLTNLITNLNNSVASKDSVDLDDFDPCSKLKYPLADSNDKSSPFEITLASNSLFVDVVDIQVDSSFSIYGTTESGSIYCWPINKEKSICESHNPKKPYINQLKDSKADPILISSTSNDVVSTKSRFTEVEDFTNSWSKTRIKSFVSKDGVPLKLSSHYTLIKDGLFSSWDSIGSTKFSQTSNIMLDTLEKPESLKSHSSKRSIDIDLQLESENILKELVVETQIDREGNYLAFITEKGKLGLYSTKYKKMIHVVSPVQKEQSPPNRKDETFLNNSPFFLDSRADSNTPFSSGYYYPKPEDNPCSTQKISYKLKIIDVLSGDLDLRSFISNHLKKGNTNKYVQTLGAILQTSSNSSYLKSTNNYFQELSGFNEDRKDLNGIDNLLFDWPPPDIGKKRENSHSIQTNSEIKDLRNKDVYHTGRIESIKLFSIEPDDYQNLQSNSNQDVVGNRSDTFFVASSCSNELVRICKVNISVINPNPKNCSKTYDLFSDIKLIFSTYQEGCDFIDLDANSGIVFGVRRTLSGQNLSSSFEPENEVFQKNHRYDYQDSIPRVTGNSNKPKSKKNSPKLPVHEQTSLRLSFLDIKHWVFALVRLIAIKIFNFIKSSKVVTFISNILRKVAIRYPQMEIIFLLFGSEKTISGRDGLYSKSSKSIESLFWATGENSSRRELVEDEYFETSNDIWELWTFDLKLWISNSRNTSDEFSISSKCSADFKKFSSEIPARTNIGPGLHLAPSGYHPRIMNFTMQIPRIKLNTDSILHSNFLSHQKENDRPLTAFPLYINHFPKVNSHQSIFYNENSTNIDLTVDVHDDLPKLKLYMPDEQSPSSSNIDTGFSIDLLGSESNHIVRSNNHLSTPVFSLPFGRIRDLKLVEGITSKSRKMVVALACGNTVKLVSF
ncbi:hypothetical protein AYI68_g891 [Smittium mucronatum]|uniref:Uncharacterized protein n=1 Tax=Smittium mucronatum TaxID=133383 RepID=A0A1R0H780_9FUNG|nr:hypothetical protein AYI68_g891 [Smittium mucronatum]